MSDNGSLEMRVHELNAFNACKIRAISNVTNKGDLEFLTHTQKDINVEGSDTGLSVLSQ